MFSTASDNDLVRLWVFESTSEGFDASLGQESENLYGSTRPLCFYFFQLRLSFVIVHCLFLEVLSGILPLGVVSCLFLEVLLHVTPAKVLP